MIGEWLHGIFNGNQETLNLFIIIIFGVFWTIFEISAITANTVFTGLINDVVPHNVIGRFYGLFRGMSLLAGIVFFYMFVGHAENYYMTIYIGLGAFYGIGFTAMCFNVKEGKYPSPPSSSDTSGMHPLKAVKSYFYECFSSRYYLWYYCMIAMAFMSLMASFIFSVYAAQSFGLTLEDYGICLVLTYTGSLLLSYPLGMLMDKFHPLRMCILTLFLHVLINLCGFIFIVDSLTFSIIFTVQGIIAGTYMTAYSGLSPMLLPRSRFSQIVSASTMVTGIGTILLGGLLGKFLDIIGHQYQYTFGIACAFSVLALIASIYLYRGFISFGGSKNYIPPEPGKYKRQIILQ